MSRLRVRKLRHNEHPLSVGRWIVQFTDQEDLAPFWSFVDHAGALKFALWKVGRIRNYGMFHAGTPHDWPGGVEVLTLR
ncbi:hypothetical protein OG474_09830 [Kribbella sp. NBC_01505]|uniref:hypothetical protein n=1 Tax=Kribbella sp. NBC_01505 TaxID=2903580 RepID=UPI00386B001A